MTSIQGFAICDRCGDKLIIQIERIDCYKRRLGKIIIYKHYCLDCFEQIINPRV